MTTTNAISSQSIGTSTNIGEGKFPQKVTKVAASTAFVVEGRVTNGAAGYLGQIVRLWYAASSYDITAAAAVIALQPSARYVDIPLSPDSGTDSIRTSLLEPALGQYIYLWCDVPTLATAATLYANVTELP